MSSANIQKPARPIKATLALTAAGAGVLLAALDQTVVVTALPPLFNDIGLPVTKIDEGAWIVNGYLIGYTAALPVMGRVADGLGHRRVYMLAMLVFMAGSALVALGNSLGWIVAARVVQAAGGGATLPIAMAMAYGATRGAARGAAIGIMAAAAEAGSVLGPLYGSAVLTFADWRWLFWLNFPLGAAVIGMLSLWAPAQAREQQPLLPLAMFRQRQFVAACLCQVLIGGGLILALVDIPLMTDTVMGKPPAEGGLRLLRLTAMIPFGAVLGGLAASRWGYRLPMAAGLGLMALGFWLLSRWPLDVGGLRMTLDLMIGGLGFGLVVTPVTLAALSTVPEASKATASAVVTAARMLGMIAGLGALSTVGKERFAALVERVPYPTIPQGSAPNAVQELLNRYQSLVSDATLRFFHEVFLAGLVVSLLALGPALLLSQRARR